MKCNDSRQTSEIGGKAFKDCRKVTKVIVPANVKSIKKNAFTNAKKLKIVKFTGTKAPEITKGAFSKLNTKKMTVQVSRKMKKSDFNKFRKALKKAGFKGKVRRVK